MTATLAWADDAPDAAPRIPAIVVSAAEPAPSFESADDPSGFVEIIDTSRAWQGYESVAELLERGAGVQVRRFGGREDFTTISVRGSTPAQVKILIDGVSLSRASNDRVNLADLPIDSVEKIEVFRGFTPVRFASSGAASVVNIVTRKDRPGVSGSLSGGSFGTVKASLHAALAAAGGGLTGSLTFRRSDGDFKFSTDTPDPTDSPHRRRGNNDSESWDVALRFDRRNADRSTLTLTGNSHYKQEGTPGNASSEALHARFRSSRSILSARWESPNGLRAATNLTYASENQRDPKRPPADPGLGFPYREASDRTLAVGLELGAAREVGALHFLEVSGEFSFEHFDSTFPAAPSPSPDRTQQRLHAAVALGDEFDAFGSGLTIAPQLRLELLHNRFDGSGLIPPLDDSDLPDADASSLDPRLGLRWSLARGLTLKANLGTYFRPPNFGELFGDDGFSAANASLGPERGINRDLGLRCSLRSARGSATAEYAFFDNDVDDMIVFVPSGARVPRPQNIGASRVQGHELRIEASLGKWLGFEANYTRQQADNRSKVRDFRGKELPSLPRDEAYLSLSLLRRRWRLRYQLELQSRIFLDRANLQRVPGHATHSVDLSLGPLAKGWRIKLEGDNLGNRQFSDVFGFPVPGRAFYLTLSYGGDS